VSSPSPQRRRIELAQEMVSAPDDGAQRVRLRFLPEGAEVRVPSGTPVFDAASWNGIAIDSTCGGHGTCKKCRVRIVSGDVPVGPLDPRAFTTDEPRFCPG
jgi:ferredoxin